MATTNITYEQALERHPIETVKVINRIRHGKSKDRDMAAQDMRWSYFWYVSVIDGSISASDFFSCKQREPSVLTYYIRLMANCNRGYAMEDLDISQPEIFKMIS